MKPLYTKDYQPQSDADYQIWDIAQKLGEPTMHFIIHARSNYGMGVILEAWGKYQDQIQLGRKIKKPGAYFNSILKECRG